ncbi:MAG: beta-N-acetylhexosaminidase [Actinomycetota bacterium]|jgi:beta-N-acetylhexosaminidase|nr:beta-N-acetylhexosaminidase [Actinomycetota bacterium]
MLHAAGGGLLALALGPVTFATLHASAYDVRDPATWSNWQLAAQLTVSCVDMGDLGDARRQAAAGIGGLTLLGTPPRQGLGRRLATARRAAPHGLAPFVMSDEEGGSVQRLRQVVYPLPSAATMGTWSPSRVHRTARAYGTRLRRLGVQMDLAPVADLTVRGSYMTSLRRTFGSDPRMVARSVQAWRLGMDEAKVASALKHWPGHGHAANTHDRAAAVPPVAVLQRRDMVPFDLELAAGAAVVMVGHLTSRGLTEPGVPASESPRALRYLRGRAGNETVILTDSLSMTAASTAQGLTPIGAAVRSLRAGADWALVCNRHPLRAVAAIRDSITSGRLPRPQAVASARRIVALKARYGLAPR